MVIDELVVYCCSFSRFEYFPFFVKKERQYGNDEYLHVVALMHNNRSFFQRNNFITENVFHCVFWGKFVDKVKL